MQIDLSKYKNKRICLAVSGGSDSMSMLWYFMQNAENYKIAFSVVNIEHGIRNEASLSDSKFVIDFCNKNQIPVFAFSVDSVAFSKQNNLSLESSARILRYNAFNSLLISDKADFIATAHQLSDNAETTLFNLFRGSSLSGVCGICDRDKFIRPLINISKKEILDYIDKNKIPFVEDETNKSVDYTRNFIRHYLTPKIKEIFPEAEKSIFNFTRLAKEDDDFLYSLSDKLIKNENGIYYIDICDKKPLFYRAVISVLKKLGVEKDFTSKNAEDAYLLNFNQNGKKVNLPNGITAIAEYGRIAFYKPENASKSVETFKVGQLSIGRRSVIVEPYASEKTTQEREKLIKENNLCRTLKFDLNKVPNSAVFRYRENGDVFKKFNGGEKKLKDYLIDKKIPQRERDNLICLAEGKDILAVLGVEISDKIKVDETTEKIYQFTLN